MSIHGTPRPCPDQPSVSQRSLEKAAIRRDMAQIPDKRARQLLAQFHSHIEKVLSRFATKHLIGTDKDDLRAIAHVAVLEAFVLYDEPTHGASLSSWVHRVVRWRVSEAANIAFAGGREVLYGSLRFTTDRTGCVPQLNDASMVPSLQLQWLRVTLKRHFTPDERALILGEVPVPTDPKARARMKFRRHKAREALMQLALEAGVITRSRDHERAHYAVKVTRDVPFGRVDTD